jgi:hypothetical protein
MRKTRAATQPLKARACAESERRARGAVRSARAVDAMPLCDVIFAYARRLQRCRLRLHIGTAMPNMLAASAPSMLPFSPDAALRHADTLSAAADIR